MNPPQIVLILILLLCAAAFSAACVQDETPGTDRNETPAATVITPEATPKATPEIVPDAPVYALPLSTSEIANYENVSGKLALTENAGELLEKNGFVIIENPFSPDETDIAEAYKTLKTHDIPVFITSDSVLHAYHIKFDDSLRQIEERKFYDSMWNISLELLNASVYTYENTEGDVKDAARLDAAYFATGLSLLEPQPDQVCRESFVWDFLTRFSAPESQKYNFTVPEFVKEDVEAELSHIKEHSGFAKSPLFHYKEDYSQYVPRGHYTGTEKLKNYFRTMIWYGRMGFLLKGGTPPDALVSPEDARIQTTAAGLIACNMGINTVVMDQWERIYSVTAFFVGYSDDLGPYEYMDAVNKVFGGIPAPVEMTGEKIKELKAELALYGSPKIYGGTGRCQAGSAAEAEECLQSTTGFRLMGQRFVPDSYVFSKLVTPYTGPYQGTGQPFTMYDNGRVFPMGLDLMSLLGSDRAKEILDLTGNSDYRDYDSVYGNLSAEFSAFSTEQWNRNLYWGWLYSLKPLLKECGEGYPAFMQTGAWQDKQLNCALSSWTELRHDTILYAKQSYTMDACAIPAETVNTGYVEPVPEFFSRMHNLTKMTREGLENFGVLDQNSVMHFRNLEKSLEKLEDIAAKELEGRELTDEDYAFITDFGETISAISTSPDPDAKKTTIVADVHTDQNTRHVLEEGTGYVNLIVAVYKLPDGTVLAACGPVMSYYEFKQPMDERLTDEKWREMLRTAPPARPEWTETFLAPDVKPGSTAGVS